MGYLISKPVLEKNSNGAIYTITGGMMGFNAFPMDISLKVNVIVHLEFELTLKPHLTLLARKLPTN